jgi:hypothetical protein
MAGQLTIDTLKASSGVLATQNGMTGIAKAWVNWDGQTSPYTNIRSYFNVSSITYNATGDYTINFTTALANANASCVGTSAYNYLAKSTGDIGATGMLSTTQAWYQNSLGSGSNRNPAVCQFVAFGA